MNKKFTFMVASMLAAGSLFSAANATVGVDRNVADFKTDRAYYIELKSTESHQVEFVVDANEKSEFQGKFVTSSSNVTSENSVVSAQWLIVKNSDNTYSFKNAKSGKLMSFTKLGDLKTDEKGDYKKFYITETAENSGQYYIQVVAEGTAQYLTVGKQTSLTTTAVGSEVTFYEAFNSPVDGATLKNLEGANFSLQFGEASLQGDSTFTNLSVVTVLPTINGDNTNNAFSLANGEFMFMVSGKAENGEIKTLDDFKAAKFVYLTKNKVENNQIIDAVTGYRYDVISGAELIKTANKIDGDNAKFTAYTSANQDGYIFKQTNVLDKNETVWVDKVDAANQVSYVASRLEDIHKSPVEIVAGKGTRVAASTVANKQMLVVNVTASKKDDAKVYALGLTANDNDKVIYSKKSEASLNYPKGQWLVTAGTTENTITLVNIQNPSVTIADIALYEAAGKGTYATNHATFADYETITLTEVTDYNKENGYLNLEEVVGQKYTLRTQDKFSYVGAEFVDAYLKLGTSIFETTPFAEQAAEWNISKVLESGKTNADTTKVTLDSYKYYAADGSKKEVKKEVLRYAFEYNLTTGEKALGTGYVAVNANSALSFYIREVSKDRYVIAYSSDSKTFESALAINGNKTTSNATVEESVFAIEPVVAAPSFEATSKHVTFSTFAGGSMTNLNNVAVLTKETEELTADNFKFYVDSVNADYVTPNFFITLNGKYLVDGYQVEADATTACELDKITEDEMKDTIESTFYLGERRLMFVDAKRVEGEDKLVVDGDTIDTPATYKFQILSDGNGDYILRTANGYVKNVNGQLVLSTTEDDAELFTIEGTSAPTSNESVVASEVKVVANNGSVVVKNAAGKNVVVSTILGQVVANEVLTSDNATINVPAGIVVVAVDGESFKVNVK